MGLHEPDRAQLCQGLRLHQHICQNIDIAFGPGPATVPRLDSKYLSFERRICKKGTGEGWQPQRSGQLDFTPRPPAHFQRGQDEPAPVG